MYFAQTEDVQKTIGALLQELISDEQMAAELANVNAVVRFDLRFPSTVLTLATHHGTEPSVHVDTPGPDVPAADIVLTMDADVCHRLWLGKENLTIAIARGLIQARGDAEHTAALLALRGRITPIYEGLLAREGHTELLSVEALELPAPTATVATGAEDAESADEAPAEESADAGDVPAAEAEAAEPAAEQAEDQAAE